MDASWDTYVNAVIVLLIFVVGMYWSTSSQGGSANKSQRPRPRERQPESAGKRPARQAPKAPATASPSTTAPATPAPMGDSIPPLKSEMVYHGKVKRFSDRNGMGFITCRATHAKYGADVRIYREEFEETGLSVNDPVAFRTVLGGRRLCPRNMPWATDIRRLEDHEVEEDPVVPTQGGEETARRDAHGAPSVSQPHAAESSSIDDDAGKGARSRPPGDREQSQASELRRGVLRASAPVFVPGAPLAAAGNGVEHSIHTPPDRPS